MDPVASIRDVPEQVRTLAAATMTEEALFVWWKRPRPEFGGLTPLYLWNNDERDGVIAYFTSAKRADAA